MALILSIILYSVAAFGQEIGSRNRELFDFIKVTDNSRMPLLSSEVQNFKLGLSLKVLEKINQGTLSEVQCLVEELIPENKVRSEHLEIIREMLNRYEYHESGYLACKATQEVLVVKDLVKIKQALWSDPLFKNEYPSGHCRGRSFLISKKLDDLGFKSKMMTIRGNIFATYETQKGFKLVSYLEHFVNVVTVTEDGKLKEYVLDPMFTDGPVLVEEYLKQTSLLIYENYPNKYELRHQSYADKLTPPLRDEKCQYNIKLLKDYEETINENLKNPDLLFQGSPTVYKTPQEAKDHQMKILLEFNP